MFWKRNRLNLSDKSVETNSTFAKNMTSKVPKIVIFEKINNRQEWLRTSPEHEIMIKFKILENILLIKQPNYNKIENWHSEHALSQKRVPEAICIQIPKEI